MNTATIEGLNVIGVARQSSSRDESVSVAEQIERMRAHCEQEGANLVEVYVEKDVSGGKPLSKRPGLSQAVADIEARRGEVLMTAYFDRLVRSLKTQAEVLERVEAKNARVMTLDFGQISNGSAVQWLSSTMVGMVSEYYRRSVAERTHDSKQASITKGVPPFPWITPAYQRRADGTLEPHETNADIIREAIRMRLASEPASWTTISRYLADNGIKMAPGSIQAMFESKLMVGEIHFGNFTPNLNAIDEPIMTHAEQRRLLQAKAVRGRYAKSPRLLARLDILHCASCDARLTVDMAKRGSQRTMYAYYRCGNSLCSRRAIVSCDTADELLLDEACRLSAELVGQASDEDEIEAALADRTDAEAALDNAIRTLAGLGGEKATRDVLDELEAARSMAVDRHERLLASTSSRLTVRTTEDRDRLSFDGKRALIKAVIARAVVTPGRGPGRISVEPRGTLLGE